MEHQENKKTQWSLSLSEKLAKRVDDIRQQECERLSLRLSRNQFVSSLIRRGLEALESDARGAVNGS